MRLVVYHARSGCGKQPAQRAGGTTSVTITNQGVSRLYRIHVPSGYTGVESVPFVTSFHGWGSSAQSDEGYMGFVSTHASPRYHAM